MTKQARALLLVALSALALRMILLVLRGDYIVYDEGHYLLLARSLRSGHGFTLNGLPHVALSPLQPLAVALLAAAHLPDLWASRMLAAFAGAALAFPVAALGAALAGRQAGLLAALLTVTAPALASFVPFFPGRSWNLYFGSEPLFLLLVFGGVAAAAKAVEHGGWRWFALTGGMCAGAYLTRAEGLVAGPLVMLVLAVSLTLRRAGRAGLRGWILAAVVGLVLAAPYIVYLRSTLGRWAYSGRVQAGRAGAEAADGASPRQRGGAVLDQFVWSGNTEALLNEMSRLTPDGLAMQSQYWGVRRESGAPRPQVRDESRAPDLPRAAPLEESAPAVPASPSGLPGLPRRLGQAIGVIMPWWFAVLAIAGLALEWRRREALLWLLPPAICALLPAALVYVEPRSLLPLVPLAAIGVAALWRRAASRLSAWYGDLPGLLAASALTAAVAFPLLRDGWRAREGAAPLQQLARAQRAVGAYLDEHLPDQAPVMSYHPAVAVWARRDWRVLPYEPPARLLRYAAAQRVGAIVLSRFHASYLRDLPRAFTVVLLPGRDSTGGPRAPAPVSAELRLELVDETPLLFVGRLAAPSPPP